MLLALVLLCGTAGAAVASSTGDERVDKAIAVIVTLCVGGGSDATVTANAANQLQIGTGAGGVTLDRHEAQGLVGGLNEKMTAVEADQANRVRDCMQPYRERIVAMLLHPEIKAEAPPEPPPPTPPRSISLLAPTFRTNFAQEADDFGRIPTIGLNPNVNDWTPTYINGGNVITTGELQHAMASGARFAMVDVLEYRHLMIPGAVSLPGAGMLDSYNDIGKQNWFVSNLLRLTGGSFDAPLVIYCQGVRCWESFNAATRAIAGGFRNVYWYRGGLEAWQAAQQS
ncbi:MAG: hypothetical protein JOY70_02665, partial [Acidisphaera sp.]|nr:hypothetical protein [Acidisphaera sp.]